MELFEETSYAATYVRRLGEAPTLPRVPPSGADLLTHAGCLSPEGWSLLGRLTWLSPIQWPPRRDARLP